MVQVGVDREGWTLSRMSGPVADGRWQDGYYNVAGSQEGGKED